MQLHQQHVNPEEDGRGGRQNGHVKSEEARQCGARDVVAAAQKSEHRPPDYGNDAGDFGAHLGRKERQLVPGQQVTAKPKTDHDKQQHHAADPGDFARWVIRPQKEDAEHVYEQRGNHQIG